MLLASGDSFVVGTLFWNVLPDCAPLKTPDPPFSTPAEVQHTLRLTSKAEGMAHLSPCRWSGVLPSPRARAACPSIDEPGRETARACREPAYPDVSTESLGVAGVEANSCSSLGLEEHVDLKKEKIPEGASLTLLLRE